MIPDNITRENIKQAIAYIDEHGVPQNRISTKYVLRHEDRDYPPKYVISIANLYANEEELNPDEFTGGRKTNDFLRIRGFKIVSKKGINHITKHTESNKKEPPEKKNEVMLSVLKISSMRTQVVQLLNQIDSDQNRYEGVKGRINRLVREGRIPRETAPSFLTITEMRNVTEYQAKKISIAESLAILASWEVIEEWATRKGYRLNNID